jgi:hypothetical protein
MISARSISVLALRFDCQGAPTARPSISLREALRPRNRRFVFQISGRERWIGRSADDAKMLAAFGCMNLTSRSEPDRRLLLDPPPEFNREDETIASIIISPSNEWRLT